MVFQHFNLFPHMTALENLIEAPIRVKKASRSTASPTPEPCSSAWVLPKRRTPIRTSLSGGQQQRVAIARALAMNPKADALRRADLGTRPRAGGDVLDVMAAACRGRHDDDRGDARDGLSLARWRTPWSSWTAG